MCCQLLSPVHLSRLAGCTYADFHWVLAHQDGRIAPAMLVLLNISLWQCRNERPGQQCDGNDRTKKLQLGCPRCIYAAKRNLACLLLGDESPSSPTSAADSPPLLRHRHRGHQNSKMTLYCVTRIVKRHIQAIVDHEKISCSYKAHLNDLKRSFKAVMLFLTS